MSDGENGVSTHIRTRMGETSLRTAACASFFVLDDVGFDWGSIVLSCFASLAFACACASACALASCRSLALSSSRVSPFLSRIQHNRWSPAEYLEQTDKNRNLSLQCSLLQLFGVSCLISCAVCMLRHIRVPTQCQPPSWPWSDKR